jgi:hypothetical protein
MENKMMYFKQYGEMRTGTNYLKRLIELNFSEVSVLGSVLGWKHGMYDLNNSPDDTNSHEEWVRGKTKHNAVYSVDGHKLPYSSSELIAIIPELNYLISIKNPHAFVVSYKKFRFPNKQLHKTVILNLCERYNSKYSRWLQFVNDNLDSCMFVPYETMLMNYSHVLFNIEQKYKLSRVKDKYTDENSPVNASTDHGLLIDKKRKFNKEYYLDRLYLNELTDEHISIIDDNIDSTLVDNIYKLGL